MWTRKYNVILRSSLLAIALTAVTLSAATAESAKKPVPTKPASTNSAAKAASPDVQFLEYLGALEGESENWTDVVAAALLEHDSTAVAKPKTVAKPAAEKK